MNKGAWVAIFILLIAASAFVYKLSLEKDSTEATEEDQELTFDSLNNTYYWLFGAVGVILILLLVAFLVMNKA
jgi:NADH:ubiquinone oxidoreductase subunit 6 (subunit J)